MDRSIYCPDLDFWFNEGPAFLGERSTLSYSPGQTLTLKSEEHYVYALIDDDEQVFYVGKSNQPYTRLQQHVQDAAPRVGEKLKTVRNPRLRILAGPGVESRGRQYRVHLH